ncbi:MAG: hypothetical protein NC236_00335 [Mycoplasma sp.]|nr:hypothetical protein [Mycoplasma sp.]
MSKNTIKNWVEKKYRLLYRKYLISKIWFIALNLISFFLVAAMIILNIYAIRKNPFQDTKPLYVSLAVLTGFVGFFTSVTSFFTLNRSSNIYRKQLKEIENEKKLFNSKDEKYNVKNKNEVFLNSILEILNPN